uniref:Ground-like domain-containing protein n=1 Tax=Acrobeloides nanus TaxID=290746 RepID=A0A914CQW9_9BILA
MLTVSLDSIKAAIGGCGGCATGGCGGFGGFPNLFGGLPQGNPFAPPVKLCNERHEHHRERIVTPPVAPYPEGCRAPPCFANPPLPPPGQVYQRQVMTACTKCPEQLYLPRMVTTPRVYPEIPPEEAPSVSRQVQKIVPTPEGPKDIFQATEDLPRPVPVPIVPTEPTPTTPPKPIPTPIVPPAGCPELQRYGYVQQYQQAYPYSPYAYRPTVVVPAPVPQPLQPVQSCCAGCAGGCGHAKNRRALSQRIHVDGDLHRNYTCSSEQLKKIMLNSFASSMALAKLEIQQDAELIIGPSFHVICSPSEFDYVTRTSLYCQVELEQGICYAFQT